MLPQHPLRIHPWVVTKMNKQKVRVPNVMKHQLSSTSIVGELSPTPAAKFVLIRSFLGLLLCFFHWPLGNALPMILVWSTPQAYSQWYKNLIELCEVRNYCSCQYVFISNSWHRAFVITLEYPASDMLQCVVLVCRQRDGARRASDSKSHVCTFKFVVGLEWSAFFVGSRS